MCRVTLFVCSEHDNIRAYKLIRCEKGVQATMFDLPIIEHVTVDRMPRLRRQGQCHDVPEIEIKVQPVHPTASLTKDGEYDCPYSLDDGTNPCH
ncbi:hypothetical protein F4825DRAFT_415007 [Nemania diffusa]|nr:hypothetical protein F4825DRAFT_415007 [Nemania diffusa]